MKRWLYILGLVILLGVGAWYISDRLGSNRAGITRISREEPGADVRYTHEYQGSFVQLDVANTTMRLISDDGKEYLVRIPQDMIDNRDMDVVGNTKGQRMVIEWNDRRSPAQVLADYAYDPTLPLNDGTVLVSIRRIYDEE